MPTYPRLRIFLLTRSVVGGLEAPLFGPTFRQEAFRSQKAAKSSALNDAGLSCQEKALTWAVSKDAGSLSATAAGGTVLYLVTSLVLNGE
jgi:hypothetical protein